MSKCAELIAGHTRHQQLHFFSSLQWFPLHGIAAAHFDVTKEKSGYESLLYQPTKATKDIHLVGFLRFAFAAPFHPTDRSKDPTPNPGENDGLSGKKTNQAAAAFQ